MKTVDIYELQDQSKERLADIDDLLKESDAKIHIKKIKKSKSRGNFSTSVTLRNKKKAKLK